MANLKVLLTGASGTMGLASLMFMTLENQLDIRVLSLKTKQDKKVLKPYLDQDLIKLIWGDIRDYDKVLEAVKDVDIILHMGALVSPLADLKPRLAMDINYGGTLNLLSAIRDLGQEDKSYFVYIGSVAETGDRMPPIHWGRVGDPIKPSINDYYAVSKVAAEREVIESGLKHWVSLRQTGIMSTKMASTMDPIILHNPLNNVLEYVSDRDSGRLIRNLCIKLHDGSLPEKFWNHIYNVGGGKSCRVSSLELYAKSFAELGVKNLGGVFKANWFASNNFHGQYYLDSDKLEDYLHFRKDDISYFYKTFDKAYGVWAKLSRKVSKVPLLQKIVTSSVYSNFKHLANKANGTLKALKSKDKKRISTFWSSRQKWSKIPEKLKDFPVFKNWNKVIQINHGYDESKPANELDLADLQGAAKFRGGILRSTTMTKGDWQTKLDFTCAFGHDFKASPKLVLEGAHWCPYCEDESWNYAERAKRDPFFAQVWYPLHKKDEPAYVYEKKVKPQEFREKLLAEGRLL